MEGLANAFSVLELDAEDDDQARTASSNNSKPELESSSSSSSSSSSNPGLRAKEASSGDAKALLEKHKKNQQSVDTSLTEYKLPLVWMDLEVTGLNIENDRILEIACIITNGSLTKSAEGPDLVIHQSKDCLDQMGEWCQSHHEASGLTKKVLHSKISEREAEKQVIEFVKKYTGTYTPLLAGNSVYVDFMFLKKYMPELASLFSHVLVDVSSVTALCLRWYPGDKKKAPAKESKHRAMDDIRESIKELKYYKENIFKSSKSKR